MTAERATYRHRNRKGNWASVELIHTFWVGQRVVRTSERRNYEDVIDESGVVIGLPDATSRTLLVEAENGTPHNWSPTEATPYLEWAKTNRARLLARSNAWHALAKRLDDNGFEVPS